MCWWDMVADRPCAAEAAAGSAALLADNAVQPHLQGCGVSSLPGVSLAAVTAMMTLSICLTVCGVANTIQALSALAVPSGLKQGCCQFCSCGLPASPASG